MNEVSNKPWTPFIFFELNTIVITALLWEWIPLAIDKSMSPLMVNRPPYVWLFWINWLPVFVISLIISPLIVYLKFESVCPKKSAFLKLCPCGPPVFHIQLGALRIAVPVPKTPPDWVNNAVA